MTRTGMGLVVAGSALLSAAYGYSLKLSEDRTREILNAHWQDMPSTCHLKGNLSEDGLITVNAGPYATDHISYMDAFVDKGVSRPSPFRQTPSLPHGSRQISRGGFTNSRIWGGRCM